MKVLSSHGKWVIRPKKAKGPKKLKETRRFLVFDLDQGLLTLISYPIVSMGLVYFSTIIPQKKSTIHVGKYTVRPMDLYGYMG